MFNPELSEKRAIGTGIHASQNSQRDLMSRAMAGDVESYGRLFELQRERLYRLAYAMLHNAAAADDCVQDASLKGLANIATYRGEAEPKAWFCAIAINECRHRLRTGKHAAAGAGDRTLETGRRPWRTRTRAALSKVVQQENHRLLALALGFLTEAQREVVVLHYDQGLSYEDVGAILDIREGAARALAHRAREVLRDKLGSEAWKNASS